MAIAQDMDRLTRSVTKGGWGLAPEMLAAVDSATLDFMSHELGGPDRTMAAYLERVDRLGMTGAAQVVDFGCGVGQWCLALGQRNGQVTGIDKTVPRIAVARQLADAHGATNVRFGQSVSDFPDLVDGVVDAIFCYSVFMFLDGREFIQLFHRLLRPGGKLYLMVDLPAWHLRALARNPRALPSFGYMVLQTLTGRQRNIVYTKARLNALIRDAGFEIVSSGADGEASFLPLNEVPAQTHADFLPNQWAGMQTLYEVCAVKSAT